MAKFAFNASPIPAKVILAAQQWTIPVGKTSFSELLELWEDEFARNGIGSTAAKVLEDKGITVEQVVKQGAAGQNLSLAFGYERLEDLKE